MALILGGCYKRPMSELASPFMDPTAVPTERELVMRVIPMPADANANGDIFGGWIMSQVDLAGSIPAVRRAKGRIATVAVNQFVFKQPVQIGGVPSLPGDHRRLPHHPQNRLGDVFWRRAAPDKRALGVERGGERRVGKAPLHKPLPGVHHLL